MKPTYTHLLTLLLFIFFHHSTDAQQLIHITAQPGDGIHRILQQHDLDTKEYYQKFIELNKTKFNIFL